MTTDQIISQLLINRGLISSAQQQEFLSPKTPAEYPDLADPSAVASVIMRHLKGSKIVLVGDYDVDGTCSTAILWETLSSASAKVIPFIPHRRLHGYGLSDQAVSEIVKLDPQLVITLDCGITASSQINNLNQNNIEVCVVDHHEVSLDQLPELAKIHSTESCATVLTWQLANHLHKHLGLKHTPDHLGLAALAVICDLIPLIGINRSVVKFGLPKLSSTTRPGLKSLYEEANLLSAEKTLNLSTYDCGFVIGPRLNAMGRLKDAMDSLRLLCTTDIARAKSLAKVLNETNKTRQLITQASVQHAIEQINIKEIPDVLLVSDSTYDEGVIGLIAAKLTEKFSRPAIALNIAPDQLKGSARSVSGVHITETLRQFQPLFKSLGGHAMAAGMTLHPNKLGEFTKAINSIKLDPQLLTKKHRVDLTLSPDQITSELYQSLSQLEPFGLGNPTPQFETTAKGVTNIRNIGSTGQHLKINHWPVSAAWFGYDPEIDLNQANRVIYQINENTWNNRTELQMIIRHISPIV